MKTAGRARYQQVQMNLENEFLKGNYQYPSDVKSTYSMLSNWKRTTVHSEQPMTDGLSFAQEGSATEDTRGKIGPKDRSKERWYQCGKLGHYAYEKDKCPPKKEKSSADR